MRNDCAGDSIVIDASLSVARRCNYQDGGSKESELVNAVSEVIGTRPGIVLKPDSKIKASSTSAHFADNRVNCGGAFWAVKQFRAYDDNKLNIPTPEVADNASGPMTVLLQVRANDLRLHI